MTSITCIRWRKWFTKSCSDNHCKCNQADTWLPMLLILLELYQCSCACPEHTSCTQHIRGCLTVMSKRGNTPHTLSLSVLFQKKLKKLGGSCLKKTCCVVLCCGLPWYNRNGWLGLKVKKQQKNLYIYMLWHWHVYQLLRYPMLQHMYQLLCYPMWQHVYQLLCYPMPWHVCSCTDCCVILCHGMCASVLSYAMACVPTVVLSYAVACVLSVVILCCGTCAHVLSCYPNPMLWQVYCCVILYRGTCTDCCVILCCSTCESVVATESKLPLCWPRHGFDQFWSRMIKAYNIYL